MERDAHGREVRRRPRPGSREPELDDPEPGFPDFEHNQWTFEGEIERLGAYARGTSRRQGRVRVVGLVVAFAMLAPILIGAISIIVRTFSG
jgi:hypothetical protein